MKKCNKCKENEFYECNNKVIKSEKEELREKLRKHSDGSGENYDNLRLRRKKNYTKEEHG